MLHFEVTTVQRQFVLCGVFFLNNALNHRSGHTQSLLLLRRHLGISIFVECILSLYVINKTTPPNYKIEPVYSIRFPMVEGRGAFVRSRPEIAAYSVQN
jgi:hypothetical protein